MSGTIMLPCISLWQPYASLIFVRDPDLRKQHETRKFALPERLLGKRIGICSTKKSPAASAELDDLAVRAFGPSYRSTLPTAALIGTVEINQWIITEVAHPASEADRIAGDWSAERFAWLTEDPQPLPTPIPVLGRQRWFMVEVPEALADA